MDWDYYTIGYNNNADVILSVQQGTEEIEESEVDF